MGLSRQVRAPVCLRPSLGWLRPGWAGAASRGISVSLGYLRHWGSQAQRSSREVHPSPEARGPTSVPSGSLPWQNVGGQDPASEWKSQRLEGGPGK